MQDRLASGPELLRFLVNHGYVIVEDAFGQALMCRREDTETLFEPINVPYSLTALPTSFLRYILNRADFTEEQFWQEIK